MDTAYPKQLGAFLRAHRQLLSPEQVGLPPTGRRRTPGLRREEVAALSGVGLAWYTWLEQGRVVASKKVLDAIARTLRLDSASHRHLLGLAGLLPPSGPETAKDELLDGVRLLLDGWTTSPAVLVDRRFDILAWNAAWTAIWSDPAKISPERRNLMWCLVGDPAQRAGLPDWEPVARAVLAQFRAQTARSADDPRTREVYAVLRRDFPDLEPWWQCQGVNDLTMREVDVRLPDGVPVRLLFSAFRPVDNADALIVVQSPTTAADRARVADLIGRRSGNGYARSDRLLRDVSLSPIRRAG